MQTIAFIPARGGSTRVVDKNLAAFKGKPLVAHTVEQAIEAAIFDRIIVSTDDERISDAVSGYPVQILGRGPDLSSNKAILLDVIRDAIQQLELNASTVIGLLLVTAPLRRVKDIQDAHRRFIDSNQQNAVVSVCEDINPIHLSWRISGECLEPVFPDIYKLNVSKRDREFTYSFNDAVIYDTCMNFQKGDRNLFGDNPLPHIMPPERSICIDWGYQLKMVQAISSEES
jgi:CMP-N-acetylneuraminic acid synthetase